MLPRLASSAAAGAMQAGGAELRRRLAIVTSAFMREELRMRMIRRLSLQQWKGVASDVVVSPGRTAALIKSMFVGRGLLPVALMLRAGSLAGTKSHAT